jgi:hypothetical protein
VLILTDVIGIGLCAFVASRIGRLHGARVKAHARAWYGGQASANDRQGSQAEHVVRTLYPPKASACRLCSVLTQVLSFYSKYIYLSILNILYISLLNFL